MAALPLILVLVAATLSLWALVRPSRLPRLVRAGDAALHLVEGRLRLRGRPFTGALVDHYRDGQVRVRSEYVEGLLHGVETTWYRSPGAPATGRRVKEVPGPKGPGSRFYPDGRVASRRCHRDGLEHGTRRTWWPSGRPRTCQPFREGRPDGPAAGWQDLPGSPPDVGDHGQTPNYAPRGGSSS